MAAVCERESTRALRDVSKPSVVHDEDIVLRGGCSRDLRITPPHFGHPSETSSAFCRNPWSRYSAEVLEAGPTVEHIRPVTRVVGDPTIRRGLCASCRSGVSPLC